MDDYHRHEALDRCSLITSMIGKHLADHPYIRADKQLRRKVGKAIAQLGEVYQIIGAKHLGAPTGAPNE